MRGLAEFAKEKITRLNKLSETMMLISSKDARPMSAPTTRAMYANDKQHGTRKRKHNKTTTKHFLAEYEQRETRLRKIMFSGDGREELY